jgi:MFS family permease
LKVHKIFYGWWIVAASFPIAVYVGGAIFYGFTAIFEPIASEMGWSYAQVSFASSLRGMESGLLAPVIGVLVDRWGPRRLIFMGSLVMFLGLFLLSRISSLAMFYGAFILIAAGMSACAMTVIMTAVANWFRRRVGLASGIAICGFGFGGLLIPVIVRLIELYDWRTAVNLLALGVLVIVLPLSLLFRHKPEQYGYLPDGMQQKPEVREIEIAPVITKVTEVSISGKQALRNRSFWQLAVSFFCLSVMLGAVVTHVMPYLSSIGFDRSQSSLVATGVPVVSAGGRFLFAWMGDKVERRKILAIVLVMMLLGLSCFELTDTSGSWLLVPYLLFFGLGYGGGIGLRPGLVRSFFGRANFGTVFGMVMGMGALGTMVGPLIAGWAYDSWGSYQHVWFMFNVFAIVAIVLVLTLPLGEDHT